MTENMNNETMDLMQMKEQMQMLKKRLDEQVEINDRQLNKAIKSGMSNIVRREVLGLIACVAMTLVLPLFEILTFFSKEMAIFTFLWLLAATICQAYELSYVMKADKLRDTNLLAMQKRLVDYKRLEYRLLLYAAPPMVLLFFGVFAWDIYNSNLVQGDEKAMTLLISSTIGGIIGGIIGGCIGYFGFFRKQMREIDEVTEQINDLLAEH